MPHLHKEQFGLNWLNVVGLKKMHPFFNKIQTVLETRRRVLNVLGHYGFIHIFYDITKKYLYLP